MLKSNIITSSFSLAMINVAGARLVLNLKSYFHYEMAMSRTHEIMSPFPTSDNPIRLQQFSNVV